jgi:hypothetical protein
VSEQIQEGLDCVCEIKSCKRESDYLAQLNAKINFNERVQTHSELFIEMLVNGSQSILKLELTSVVIVGASLLSHGAIDLFTYLPEFWIRKSKKKWYADSSSECNYHFLCAISILATIHIVKTRINL